MPGHRSLRLVRRAATASAVAVGVTLVGAVSASAQTGNGTSTYTVRKGDDLWRIAFTHGSTTAAVAAANGISSPYIIRPGERLIIPAAWPAGHSSSSSPSSSGSPGRSSGGHEPAVAVATHPSVATVLSGAARQTGVPLPLLEALTWQESGWQQGVVSASHASGVGQVISSTVSFVNNVLGAGNLNPAVTSDNARISATFLAYLLAQAHDNQKLAIAYYYQGMASVRQNGIYPSTAHYVDNVTALASRFAAAG